MTFLKYVSMNCLSAIALATAFCVLALPSQPRCFCSDGTMTNRPTTQGKTYYIDPAGGDDSHNGLTPTRPLKTYAQREFVGGDTVLFKRGSIIRDVLHTRNGSEQSPIVYGAYGEGDKPVFLGSMPVNNTAEWIEERPCVWRYTGSIPSEVCNFVFDNGKFCGILRWKIEDLQQAGDWHYTAAGQQRGGGGLYLFSPSNPGKAYKSVECVLWGARRLVGPEHDVILENLSFRNSGVHGYQASHARNIVIRNCDFRFIGGAVWNRERQIRFGNAVEFWDGASDITVEGCLFDNIYDSGVTHQGGETRNIPERLFFRNNTFVDCGLAAYECREPSREVYFEHNTCVNTGGGFSMQGKSPPRPSDPYPQPLGYHVWVWMIDPHTQPGNVYIRHNLFCQSHGAALCLIADPVDRSKFILDYNGYWQTNGQPLIRLGNGTKNWAEAMKNWEAAGGPLIDWEGRQSYLPSDFGRYQAESGQETHGRVAKPIFVDSQRGNYQQREESPCLGMGMQTNLETRDPNNKKP